MPDPSYPPAGDLRRAALVAACLVHGVAGETAPAAVGIAEITVGLLLAAAVDWRRAVRLVDGSLAADPAEDPSIRWIARALHALFWPPLLVAVVTGTSSADVLRDLAPLGFMGLALVLPREPGGGRTVGWLSAGLVVAGAAMATRAVTGFRIEGSDLVASSPTWAGDLLLNDPSVAFAAALLAASALRTPGIRALLATVVAAALLTALVVAGHRAGVAGCLVTIALAADRGLALGRLLVAGLLLATAVAGGSADRLVDAVDIIVAKSFAVGLNARPEEFAAAVAAAADGPFGLAFGQGWGARFVNPATGGETVRFAHGLAGHLVLKAGLVGLAAGLVGATAVVALVVRVGAGTSAVRAAWPALAIAAAVHTSHKFLTFGLLLALIVAEGVKPLETQS